jgi:hypothetical protein
MTQQAKEVEVSAPDCPLATLSDKELEAIAIVGDFFMRQAKDPDNTRTAPFIRAIYQLGAQQQLENMSEYILENFYIYKVEKAAPPYENFETFNRKVTTLSDFLSFFR